MNFISFCKSVDHWNPPEIDPKGSPRTGGIPPGIQLHQAIGSPQMVDFFLAKGSPKKQERPPPPVFTQGDGIHLGIPTWMEFTWNPGIHPGILDLNLAPMAPKELV